MGDKCNCYRFSPRDSLSGAVAQIADYLSKHPGWNETELKAFIDRLNSDNVVETFNGRSGNVTLDKNDVNNLLIANCYFAEADETIESIDVLALYKLGIRIVFTQYSSEVDAYTLAYGIEYYPTTDTAKAYLFSSGSGGGTGDIVSVNGKTGAVNLKVVDVSKGNSPDENAYIFIDESDDYPDVISSDSSKLGGQLPSYYASAEDVSKLKDDIATLYDQTDALFALCLDGTPATYKAVMKSFFLTNGAASATPAELTALCDRWYTATRTGWDGGVKFYAPDVSAVSDGEKIGNNAGLTCTPSTNTVAGQDDYAGLPLFACVDVNWIVDPNTLEPVITAIDGITDSFDRYDPAKFVGVMQMSGYRWWNDGDTNYYLRGYCDSLKPYANIEPLAEAVRSSDNSVRPWVVHAKYMAKVECGKFTCYSGVIPTAYSVSHNSSHTYAKAVGSQYSGGTAADNAWLKLMSMIKYGIMTQDGVNQGCVQYNFQYPAAVAESGVQRVIITKGQAANLIVGSSVIIGNYAGSLDRNNSGMYSITGQTGAVITSIQEVTIDGNTYAAVNVDCAAFDTVANGASATGTTYISTWHWRSGTCDNVLGNDGSPDSPGSGKYPAMIQGIEYSVGGYEVYADVILNLYKDSNDVYWYEPYLVNRSAQQSTRITPNYKATGLKCQQPDASNWIYIKKEGYAKGIYFPVLVGGSSSTYHRDGFYMNSESAGTCEWLAFGHLNLGVGHGGLSVLFGGRGLSLAWWRVLARLSPNGNRGEWAA